MTEFKVCKGLLDKAGLYPKSSLPETKFNDYIDEYCYLYAPKDNPRKSLEFRSHIQLIKDVYQTLPGSQIAWIESSISAIRDMIIDKRLEHKVIYPLDVLVFVIVLAKACGCNRAEDIAQFYATRQLELLLLVPGMPSPKHRVSAATITNILRMVSPEQIDELMRVYFRTIKLTLDKMIEANCQRPRIDGADKMTYTFDGQEVTDSYRKGNTSRHCKGGHIVSIFNSTLKQALTSVIASAKNQETEAFLKMLSKTGVDLEGSVVMCDAINSKVNVSKVIISKGADYLLNIKKNGFKDLLGHLEGTFNRLNAMPKTKDLIKIKHCEKKHGRRDTWLIEVAPATLVNTMRFDLKLNNVQTIVRFYKESQKIIDGLEIEKNTKSERYYLSSLSFSKDNSKQILQSILDYWAIEAHHGRLDDEHLFDQDSTQSCSENYLGNTASINKIAYNFLTWKRMQVSTALNRKTPVSYRTIVRDYSQGSLFDLLEDLYVFYSSET